MKRISILLISISIVFASCSKLSKPKLTNERDTVTYMIGVSMAKQLKSIEIGKIKPEIIERAFAEVFAGDSIKFTDQMVQMKIQAFLAKLQKEQSDKNLKEGQAVLEKNKKNPGVIITPSGLQYQIIKEGTGPKPDSTDAVSVNFRGTLINGEEFDARKAYTLPLRGVFAGMTEAFLKMGVGSKWKLFIPANLAYGEQAPRQGKIKPNMALIFEIDVLGIEPKKPQPANDPMAQMKAKMKMK